MTYAELAGGKKQRLVLERELMKAFGGGESSPLGEFVAHSYEEGFGPAGVSFEGFTERRGGALNRTRSFSLSPREQVAPSPGSPDDIKSLSRSFPKSPFFPSVGHQSSVPSHYPTTPQTSPQPPLLSKSNWKENISPSSPLAPPSSPSSSSSPSEIRQTTGGDSGSMSRSLDVTPSLSLQMGEAFPPITDRSKAVKLRKNLESLFSYNSPLMGGEEGRGGWGRRGEGKGEGGRGGGERALPISSEGAVYEQMGRSSDFRYCTDEVLPGLVHLYSTNPVIGEGTPVSDPQRRAAEEGDQPSSRSSGLRDRGNMWRGGGQHFMAPENPIPVVPPPPVPPPPYLMASPMQSEADVPLSFRLLRDQLEVEVFYFDLFDLFCFVLCVYFFFYIFILFLLIC